MLEIGFKFWPLYKNLPPKVEQDFILPMVAVSTMDEAGQDGRETTLYRSGSVPGPVDGHGKVKGSGLGFWFIPKSKA